MKKILSGVLLMLFAFGNSILHAQKTDTVSCPFDCCRPDGHAPLGVMTDHIHGRHKWNISYTLTSMMMKGNQSGTSNVSSDNMMMNYAMSPTTMTMQMHMLMVGFGITSKFTVMAMIDYNNTSMQMDMNQSLGMVMPGMTMGNPSANSTSSGFGDTHLYGLYDLWDKKGQRIIVSAGLSIPTGSIVTKGPTIMGNDTSKLAYAMQLGTGSYAILPGVTYTGQSTHFSWGGAIGGDVKTGANAQGYQWGNEFKGTGWLAYKCFSWLSASARMEYINTGSMKGYDKDIALMMNNDPTANSANYGGNHTNLLFGVNFYVPKGTCKELRLGAEYLVPVSQNLNGTQMPLQSGFLVGIQYLFM
jgi:hypothetical protein